MCYFLFPLNGTDFITFTQRIISIWLRLQTENFCFFFIFVCIQKLAITNIIEIQDALHKYFGPLA